MRSETRALLSPGPDQLPLFYEAGRLFARSLDPLESLSPLLGLLEKALPVQAGIAAARGGDDVSLRFVAVSDPRDAVLLGTSLDLDALDSGKVLVRLMAKAIEVGEALDAEVEGSLLFAAPALVSGRVEAVLALRLRGGAGREDSVRARSALEGIAALLAEALLRGRMAQAGGCREGGARKGPPPELETGPLAPLVGASEAMSLVKAFIRKVAPTQATVLITGESGTGKELAARAIHGLSSRAEGPFVAVNCAALPEALIESELFGHERGAFTGAHSRRSGRFEMASGGSIFLDEVAELPLALQAKLLRVLQERSFERLGGSTPLKSDARVIAASNRDLEREVVESRFRADLYWRLNVLPLRMPPLRERGADVVLLADRFTEARAAKGRPVTRISTPALDLLTSYHWPGNVRELENAIERATILSNDGVIHAYHLPPSLQSAQSTGKAGSSSLDAALARLERELLVEALKTETGNAAAAARRLGISERRMGLALRRYGIDGRRFRTRM